MRFFLEFSTKLLKTKSMSAFRKVYRGDAIEWLNKNPEIDDASFICSMPDISEFTNPVLRDWKKWFQSTAELVMSRCSSLGVSIFYQSDIKTEGVWVDKAFLVQKAAEAQGCELLWHKIVCRSPVRTITHGRPSYSHLLCFSKDLRINDHSKSTADVVEDLSEKTWPRGMGIDTYMFVADFILQQTKSKTIVNPFCGEGGMLAVANSKGLNAVGIERSQKRAEKAQRQSLSLNQRDWLLKPIPDVMSELILINS